MKKRGEGKTTKKHALRIVIIILLVVVFFEHTFGDCLLQTRADEQKCGFNRQKA